MNSTTGRGIRHPRHLEFGALTATLLCVAAQATEPAIILNAEQERDGTVVAVRLDQADTAAPGGITLTGRVEVAEHGPGPVLAPTDARVVAVYAHPGEAVKAGDPIIAVAGPATVALRQSGADAATLASAARQRLERDRRLYDAGIIALSRLEQTTASAELAFAQQRSQRQLLGSADFSAGDRLILRAPRAGIVSGRAFGTGDPVTSGELIAYVGKPLAPLISLDATVPVARALRIGDRLAIHSTGCDDTAVLHAIAPTVDAAMQTVTLHAELQASSCLLPGEVITATATPHEPPRGTFAVPPAAFVRRGKLTYVFVRKGRGFEPVAVDAEAVRMGYARAAQLQADSFVVVRGAAMLKAEWLKGDRS